MNPRFTEDRLNGVLRCTSRENRDHHGIAKQVAGAMGELPFETKRRVLELIQLRVDVISRTQVKLSGVISDGLIVDISSA